MLDISGLEVHPLDVAGACLKRHSGSGLGEHSDTTHVLVCLQNYTSTLFSPHLCAGFLFSSSFLLPSLPSTITSIEQTYTDVPTMFSLSN